ncbi:hypothetical protein TSUD_197490 [Trifolium subterraneum]|uniref:Uncharacterized protein n=1 Tax=Trifolium subterraneum TaxID=3900 RepID=A0A2Z6LG86_TRISU|nr:hypothetical protein TSUD_197490 [Trifolium subterraneum]
MKIYDDVPKGEVQSNGVKRKRGSHGGLDTQHYGRGKRAREVTLLEERKSSSYEEQRTEEFEKMCQAETQDSPKVKVEEMTNTSSHAVSSTVTQPIATVPQLAATVPKPVPTVTQPASVPSVAPTLPSVKNKSPAAIIPPVTSGIVEVNKPLKKGNEPERLTSSAPDSVGHSVEVTGLAATPMPTNTGHAKQSNIEVAANALAATPMPSHATIESISRAVDPLTAQIVPSTLSTVNPLTPGSESVSAKRQGRKTLNRAEPPRRRGRKSAPILSAAPDAHIGQVPKLSHHAQISPVSSLVGIATSNVPQARAFEILLPSGVANDSNRKERASDPAQNKQQKVVSTRIAQNKQQKVVSTRIDSALEVFSGTCLPKPKAGVDASGSQSVEDKKCADIETAGAACHTSKEKQSEVASDMQNLEGKPCLDTPATGASK